jgi:hypothetical protein
MRQIGHQVLFAAHAGLAQLLARRFGLEELAQVESLHELGQRALGLFAQPPVGLLPRARPVAGPAADRAGWITPFMRDRIRSPCSSGAATVSTVAKVESATRIVTALRSSVREYSSSIMRAVRYSSEIEVDHLAHHQDAGQHP